MPSADGLWADERSMGRLGCCCSADRANYTMTEERKNERKKKEKNKCREKNSLFQAVCIMVISLKARGKGKKNIWLVCVVSLFLLLCAEFWPFVGQEPFSRNL